MVPSLFQDRSSHGSVLDYGKNRNVVALGQIISDKYKLLRLLGDGGMGSVYEAEHLTLGTHVAIKVLHAELTRKAGIADRFLQEARVSAKIRSPHVVQVTDVDRTPDGVAYLVMELLQGEPLSGVVKREQKLAVPVACEYTAQILQALEAAHALGVIHRDLKPENVFVTFQGGKPVIKLIDFGIAKLKTEGQTRNLTVAGMLMGTPEYMAPEQAYSADKVDVRADLYSVGVMLYEMLSGKVPAMADDPRVLIVKVERGDITPLVQAAPGVPPEIAGFVHRAMAPRPELRFANATEMRLALEGVLAGKRVGTAKLAQVPPTVSVAPAPAAFHEQRESRPEPPAGTGTVMGAPMEGALAQPQFGSSPPAAMPGGGTAHGAPIGPGFQPTPVFEPTRPPPSARQGGSGLIIGLAIVALLLGAGAVVTYFASTQPSGSSVPVEPLTVATAATTAPTATAANTPTQAITPVTPLNTSLITPAPPEPTHHTTPKKDAGAPTQRDAGGGSAAADAGAGQTTIVTPFGTFQFPGPRPPFYPADQPWPPATFAPIPPPP